MCQRWMARSLNAAATMGASESGQGRSLRWSRGKHRLPAVLHASRGHYRPNRSRHLAIIASNAIGPATGLTSGLHYWHPPACKIGLETGPPAATLLRVYAFVLVRRR